MTTTEAIKILRETNKWRRGEHPYDGETPEEHRDMPYSPRVFGEAIDALCDAAEEELTWQDIKRIVNIADDMLGDKVFGEKRVLEDEYYKEVLKRYNEKKQ